MKFNNLEVGRRYDNYKVLCEALGEKVKTGDSKKAQMKIIDANIKYDKEGYGFRITKINDEADEIEDNRGKNISNIADYTPSVSDLILDIMVQDGKNGKIYLSKSALLEKLNMVNKNYGKFRFDMAKLSSQVNVDIRTTEDWYNSTGTMLDGNITTALTHLEKRSLIIWSRVYTVNIDVETDYKLIEVEGAYDANGNKLPNVYRQEPIYEEEHREATEEESKVILGAEYEVLQAMGYEHKGKVISSGKWEEFIEEVDKILSEEHHINFYYKSYKILFHEDAIVNHMDNLLSKRMSEEELTETESIINLGVQKRTLDNAQRRHEKAKECFGKSKSYRSSEEYIAENEILTNTLMDKDAKELQVRGD